TLDHVNCATIKALVDQNYNAIESSWNCDTKACDNNPTTCTAPTIRNVATTSAKVLFATDLTTLRVDDNPTNPLNPVAIKYSSSPLRLSQATPNTGACVCDATYNPKRLHRAIDQGVCTTDVLTSVPNDITGLNFSGDYVPVLNANGTCTR